MPAYHPQYYAPPPAVGCLNALYNASWLVSSQELFPSVQNFLRIENRTIIKEVSSWGMPNM